MNLKILRKNKRLTQENLAKKMGLNQKIISNYETGKTEPDIKTLKRLADYFDCSIDYLLSHESKGILHMDSFTEKQKSIIDLLPKMSDSICERAESYIYGLIEGEKDRIAIMHKFKN